jgi:hypothetical protein
MTRLCVPGSGNCNVRGFDEAAYLAANPDVRDAVSRGAFRSGLDHFEKHGQFELRAGAPACENPLLYFVHVPKTAGSSVNAVLKKALPNGRDHCEALVKDPEKFKLALSTLPWLSGHVDFDLAVNLIDSLTERRVRVFACMRNPLKQIMSHYNWLIEIHAKGPDFYNAHPPVMHAISAKIRSSPLTTDAVIENLQHYPGLFSNHQCRVLFGYAKNFDLIERYEFIGREDTMERLLAMMTGTKNSRLPRTNVSRYHFDPTIFFNSRMMSFLEKYNSEDEKFYKGLPRRFGRLL